MILLGMRQKTLQLSHAAHMPVFFDLRMELNSTEFLILFKSVSTTQPLGSFSVWFIVWPSGRRGVITAKQSGQKESSNFFCSFPFRPDIILKKRVQNDIASLLLGRAQNWSWAIVSTELTQYPGDPNELMLCPEALIYNQEEFGALRGRLNRSIFTHCDFSDRSSLLQSKLAHQIMHSDN